MMKSGVGSREEQTRCEYSGDVVNMGYIWTVDVY